MMLKVLATAALLCTPLTGAKCIPDCEHTYYVIVNCNAYSALGAAIYAPQLLQRCPART